MWLGLKWTKDSIVASNYEQGVKRYTALLERMPVSSFPAYNASDPEDVASLNEEFARDEVARWHRYPYS